MRIHKRYLLCFLIFSLVAAGCSGDKTPQAGSNLPRVSVWKVTTRPVSLTNELSGRTSAVEVAEVRPQVSGIIQKRLFTEGQEVTEGQQLYQIDPAIFQAALAEAKASLLQAQANYNAQRALAERQVSALKVNAVSKQEHDNAIAARNSANAQVAIARAAVDTATINLQYTKVNAPISGHIGISSVTPGALVTANQAQPLALVQQLDEMYVDVTQSSAEVLRLKRELMEGKLASAGDGGAMVDLVLEDGTRYEHTGTLQLADISVNTGTGTVTIRAKFANPKKEISPGRFERLLFPGMFVRAIVREAVNENAVMVPQTAVGRDTMGRATVYVVRDITRPATEEEKQRAKGQGKEIETVSGPQIVEEVIVIERSIGTEYLVSAGLKPEELLVIDGRIKVRPGMLVATVDHPTEKDKDGYPVPVISALKQAEQAESGKQPESGSGK